MSSKIATIVAVDYREQGSKAGHDQMVFFVQALNSDDITSVYETLADTVVRNNTNEAKNGSSFKDNRLTDFAEMLELEEGQPEDIVAAAEGKRCIFSEKEDVAKDGTPTVNRKIQKILCS